MYDVARALDTSSVYNAFRESREAKQQSERNALALDAQRQQVSQNALVFKEQADERAAKRVVAQAQWALQSPSPAQALRELPGAAADLASSGIDVNTLDDDNARQILQRIHTNASASIGVGPPQPGPKNFQQWDPEKDVYEVGPNGPKLIQKGQPKAETFTGQPTPMMLNGKPVMAIRGSNGTVRPIEGAAPYEAPKAPSADSKPQLVSVTLPDGTVQQQWLRPGETSGQPVGAPTKPGGRGPTEAQAKANLFGQRMMESDRIISGTNYSPSAIGAKQAAGSVPLIGGALEWGGNMMLGDNNQSAEQAQRDFVNAVLRRESGAAISPTEFENARKQYFPQPGDSAKVKDQKKRNREMAVAGFKAEAGSFWGAGMENQGANSGAHPDLAAADAILRGGKK